MGDLTYGDLAKCSIAEYSAKTASGYESLVSVPAGKMIFFVSTKILELLAIPILAVVTVAWAPLMLPLLGLALAVKFCGGKSAFDAVLTWVIWPLFLINIMWKSTLKGLGGNKLGNESGVGLGDDLEGRLKRLSGNEEGGNSSESKNSQTLSDKFALYDNPLGRSSSCDSSSYPPLSCSPPLSQYPSSSSLECDSSSSVYDPTIQDLTVQKSDPDSSASSSSEIKHAKRRGRSTARKVTQVVGLVATALAVAAAATTVVLIFTTALIPLVVLWPAVIACGCVAILGLVAFAIARFAGEGAFRKTYARGPVYITDITKEKWAKIEAALKKEIRFHPNPSNNYLDIKTNMDSRYGMPTNCAIGKEKGIAVLNELEKFSIDTFITSFAKDGLGYNLFECCKNDDVRVEILRMLKDRLLPEEIALLLYDGKYDQKTAPHELFDACVKDSLKIQLALDALRASAGSRNPSNMPTMFVPAFPGWWNAGKHTPLKDEKQKGSVPKLSSPYGQANHVFYNASDNGHGNVPYGDPHDYNSIYNGDDF